MADQFYERRRSGSSRGPRSQNSALIRHPGEGRGRWDIGRGGATIGTAQPSAGVRPDLL